MPENESELTGRVIGRYVLCSEIAAGGMATVHLGRLIGPGGFSRTVAIKRLHPQFAKDPEFVAMFLDEARLAGRVRHPNVASVLDVVALEGELFLVMEFVLGESLSRLLRNTVEMGNNVPIPIAIGVGAAMLRGLHSAHESTNEIGEPLGLVHRDVSPHNVLVGADGVPRVVDFGIAKAANRAQTTREGQLKGKLSYMAPEQVTHGTIDRRTDVYAAAVVLWETLAGARLFPGDEAASILNDVMNGADAKPSALRPEVWSELDAVVMRGLAIDPDERYPTARDMALDLERVGTSATPGQIGEWVEETARDALHRRTKSLAEVESMTARHSIPDMEGPDSGVRAQIASWSGATPSSQKADAEADPTVVNGPGRESVFSSPSLTSAVTGTTPPSRKRQRNLSLAVGLGIAAAGLALGLWLGGDRRGEAPDPTRLRLTPASPASATGTEDPSATPSADPATELDPAPAASAGDSAESAEASSDGEKPSFRGSRTGSKPYKGRVRRPPSSGGKAKPPSNNVDFDDLTRQ